MSFRIIATNGSHATTFTLIAGTQAIRQSRSIFKMNILQPLKLFSILLLVLSYFFIFQ